MGAVTKIEWADATVNFWTGCTKLTPACDNCYAGALSKRMGWAIWGAGQPRHRFKDPVGACFALERRAIREGRRLRVFVNSLSDTFDAEVPDAWRDEIFAVAALCPNLDFMLLTKRHKVMREYVTAPFRRNTVELVAEKIKPATDTPFAPKYSIAWPLPNVWLGVTAEDQARADLRIPDLLATPAAVRFVSVEPLLGAVDLTAIERQGGAQAAGYMRPLDGRFRTLDWVIVGGESGPNARPMHPAWARFLRDQCAAAGVPFFFKQWGEWAPDPRQQNPRGDYVSVRPGERPKTCAQAAWMARVGKAAAGRLLDGVERNAMPAAHRVGSSAQRPAPQGVLVSSDGG